MGAIKKYFTEEERLHAKREAYKRYNKKRKEKTSEYYKQYYRENKEKINEQHKQYYKDNKEKISELHKQCYKENKETPELRAQQLCSSYNAMDKIAERPKGNLTAKWIYDNIIFKPCAHCGKTGWNVIGCNRIDNSKPHTIDNVEPCCKKCNNEEFGKTVAKIICQCSLDGKLIKIWKSISECGKNGFNAGHIVECCKGKRKKHNGFIWMYQEDYEKMKNGEVNTPPIII